MQNCVMSDAAALSVMKQSAEHSIITLVTCIFLSVELMHNKQTDGLICDLFYGHVVVLNLNKPTQHDKSSSIILYSAINKIGMNASQMPLKMHKGQVDSCPEK